jgi:hypothetical protein
MLKLKLPFGILLLALAIAITSNKSWAQGADLYQNIYQSLQASTIEEPLDNTARALGISSDELESALSQGENLDQICADLLENIDYFECLEEAEALFAFEQTLSEMVAGEKQNALASEIWSNGTLFDSDFDLVVDLNVVDVLYFGSEAQTPNSRTFDPFARNRRNDTIEEDTARSQQSETSSAQGSQDTAQDNESVSQNEEDVESETSETESEDSNPVNEQGYLENNDYLNAACRDPEALYFTGNNNANQEATENNSEAEGNHSEANEQSEGSNGSRGNQNSAQDQDRDLNAADNTLPPLPEEPLGGDYPEFELATEEECSGEEVALFGNIYCVPEFCTSVLCVDIEFVPGRAKVATRENSIKGLIDFAFAELEEAYLQKERLAPERNTLVHFDIRSWNLSDLGENIRIIDKAPTSTDRTTVDQFKTTREEFYEMQSEMFPEGIGAFADNLESTRGFINNRALLDSLLRPQCEEFLARQLSGASESELFDQCLRGLDASTSPLLQDPERIRKFKIELNEEGQWETKNQAWRELTTDFQEFTKTAQALNQVLRSLPAADKYVRNGSRDCTDDQ